MKNVAVSSFLILIVGLVVGYLIGAHTTGKEPAGHDHTTLQMEHDDHAHDGEHDHEHEHAHDVMEITDHENAPMVDLVMHQDPKSGWNAQILLENYRLAPENASTAHVDGEGHAHIYVDGEKINRVYGEWYHLGSIEPGMHEVSVTLSTNDHKELTHDGVPIGDSEMIEVAG